MPTAPPRAANPTFYEAARVKLVSAGRTGLVRIEVMILIRSLLRSIGGSMWGAGLIVGASGSLLSVPVPFSLDRSPDVLFALRA